MAWISLHYDIYCGARLPFGFLGICDSLLMRLVCYYCTLGGKEIYYPLFSRAGDGEKNVFFFFMKIPIYINEQKMFRAVV